MKNVSRLVSWVIIVCSCVVLAAIAIAALRPPLFVLLYPRIKSTSPYCTRWKASLDSRVLLKQHFKTDEILRASTLVRSESNLHLWSTPEGEFWVPGDNRDILALLLAQEDRNIYGKNEWGVQRGDVVLDAGAYIGTWTKQALARGARLVVAIEPSPDSVECLRRNLAREVAAGQVIIYPKGIWDSEGALSFAENNSSGVGNSFVQENSTARVISIPVTTIDRLVAELHLSRVDFIKADVKGATERLVRGGSEVIRRYGPRLAFSTEESVDHPESIAALVKKVRPGYRMLCGPCLLREPEIYTDVLFFR